MMPKPALGYPGGYRMRHNFVPSFIRSDSHVEIQVCKECGLSLKSHTDEAVCYVCGTQTYCDLIPNSTHPDKQLVCVECHEELIKADVIRRNERQARLTMLETKTPGDYFTQNAPSIKDIVDEVNRDESITDKSEAICQIVLQRIKNLQDNVLGYNQKIRELQSSKDRDSKTREEMLIYLNEKSKELSLNAQARLGIGITYNPEPKEKKPKVPSSPGRMTNEQKEEIQKYCNMYQIPFEVLRGFMTVKKMTAKQAADYYTKLNSKVDNED